MAPTIIATITGISPRTNAKDSDRRYSPTITATRCVIDHWSTARLYDFLTESVGRY